MSLWTSICRHSLGWACLVFALFLYASVRWYEFTEFIEESFPSAKKEPAEAEPLAPIPPGDFDPLFFPVEDMFKEKVGPEPPPPAPTPSSSSRQDGSFWHVTRNDNTRPHDTC